MNKFKFIVVLSYFGLAVLLNLLNLSKISFSAEGVTINIYPAIALILLLLVLVWRKLQKGWAVH